MFFFSSDKGLLSTPFSQRLCQSVQHTCSSTSWVYHVTTKEAHHGTQEYISGYWKKPSTGFGFGWITLGKV